jgi:Arm DNA-binding domain
MKVKYRLLFDRKNEVSTKGVGLIQIQVYLNGSRRYFSTKLYLSQKEWDIKKNSPKDPYTAKLLRERIAEFEKFEVSNKLCKQLSITF